LQENLARYERSFGPISPLSGPGPSPTSEFDLG